ncbi:MAG: T9SS type A sorting domain-containing protein [Chitinophagales bacterium]|nr:T9SS type A sorting domain-containing protein [Chitinophagales bacterium]
MKQLFTIVILLTSFIFFTSNTLRVIKPYPPKATSGAPGENTCIVCHSGTPLNGGPGSIDISYDGRNNKYVLGKTYKITVTAIDPSEIHYSFETTSLDASNNPAGKPSLIDPSNTLIQTDARTGRVYVTDYDATPLNTWTFNWKAPSTNVGNVTFYLDGVEANGDIKPQGDHVYTNTWTLTPKAVTKEEELAALSSLDIFPNPIQSTATLNYTLDEPSLVSIQILDLSGKNVKTIWNRNENEGTHQLNFNREGLNSGAYMIQIQIGNNTEVKKIVID